MSRQKDQRHRDASAFSAELRRFQLGQIPSLQHSDSQDDPALAEGFEKEQREKAVGPMRVACALALTLVPIFALLDWVFFHKLMWPLLMARGIVLLLIGSILALSYHPFGRHRSRELGLMTSLVVGEFLIVLNLLGGGQMQLAFTPSMLLVLLGSSTLFRMRSWKVVAAIPASSPSATSSPRSCGSCQISSSC